MRALLLTLMLLSACGRPLAENERALAQGLYGDSLDPAPVRLVENGLIGLVTREYPARPRTTCRERILPPSKAETFTTRAAGIVLWSHIHIRPDLMQPDYARAVDGTMDLGAAMFLAHELTHVWQWQNRALTRYSPLRGGGEHLGGGDPYLFDPAADDRAFLEFGYEQQASLVEEYVCCQALDPQGARTARLRALLAQVMPKPALSLPDDIRLPWPQARRRGICA
ncbi:MAG: hypothetical protein HLUCCA12_01120 [Rhodobacteraceae bacterium HLUCCA12]|nr:MAG: hypothetical protein HLUCCA12_01120 [Rhodobacteraceae bacterium HLUCCA12]